MKFAKLITTSLSVASLIGTVLLPVTTLAGEQVQPVEASIEPTAQQIRTDLTTVGRRLHTAEHASVANSEAQSDYVAAWRDYRKGDYDNALEQVNKADSALTSEPN